MIYKGILIIRHLFCALSQICAIFMPPSLIGVSGGIMFSGCVLCL